MVHVQDLDSVVVLGDGFACPRNLAGRDGAISGGEVTFRPDEKERGGRRGVAFYVVTGSCNDATIRRFDGHWEGGLM